VVFGVVGGLIFRQASWFENFNGKPRHIEITFRNRTKSARIKEL